MGMVLTALIRRGCIGAWHLVCARRVIFSPSNPLDTKDTRNFATAYQRVGVQQPFETYKVFEAVQ